MVLLRQTIVFQKNKFTSSYAQGLSLYGARCRNLQGFQNLQGFALLSIVIPDQDFRGVQTLVWAPIIWKTK